MNLGTINDVSLDFLPDIIIYSHVLEHILNINQELKIIRKVLSFNGILYIEVPGIKTLKMRYNHDFLRYLQNAHTFYFTLNTLTNILFKNGFVKIVGNNQVKSIFKKAIYKKEINYGNEYLSTMFFLYSLEYFRSLYSLRRILKIIFQKIFKLVR